MADPADASYNEGASVRDDLDRNLASTPNAQRSELRADVAVMIELGVIEWKDIKLHEGAFHARNSPPVEESTQRSRSPEEIAKQLRFEREQLMSRAVGGPVKRGGFDEQKR